MFDAGQYWDVRADFCKQSGDDILVKYVISNRGSDTARIRVLPTLWFRNMWSWGDKCEVSPVRKSGLVDDYNG